VRIEASSCDDFRSDFQVRIMMVKSSLTANNGGFMRKKNLLRNMNLSTFGESEKTHLVGENV
jgi:hypothetical protein